MSLTPPIPPRKPQDNLSTQPSVRSNMVILRVLLTAAVVLMGMTVLEAVKQLVLPPQISVVIVSALVSMLTAHFALRQYRQVLNEVETWQRTVQQQNDQLQEFANRVEHNHSELQKANLQLEHLARTDGLTGLNNHRVFQEILEAQWHIAVRYGMPLSLLLIDVDNFKQYNDQFGHPAGDEVLKMVAQTLRDGTRITDCAARYGGEEFAIILPHTNIEGAMITAERIRRAIAQLECPHRVVTVSVGLSTYTPDLKDIRYG